MIYPLHTMSCESERRLIFFDGGEADTSRPRVDRPGETPSVEQRAAQAQQSTDAAVKGMKADVDTAEQRIEKILATALQERVKLLTQELPKRFDVGGSLRVEGNTFTNAATGTRVTIAVGMHSIDGPSFRFAHGPEHRYISRDSLCYRLGTELGFGDHQQPEAKQAVQSAPAPAKQPRAPLPPEAPAEKTRVQQTVSPKSTAEADESRLEKALADMMRVITEAITKQHDTGSTLQTEGSTMRNTLLGESFTLVAAGRNPEGKPLFREARGVVTWTADESGAGIRIAASMLGYLTSAESQTSGKRYAQALSALRRRFDMAGITSRQEAGNIIMDGPGGTYIFQYSRQGDIPGNVLACYRGGRLQQTVAIGRDMAIADAIAQAMGLTPREARRKREAPAPEETQKTMKLYNPLGKIRAEEEQKKKSP